MSHVTRLKTQYKRSVPRTVVSLCEEHLIYKCYHPLFVLYRAARRTFVSFFDGFNSMDAGWPPFKCYCAYVLRISG